MQKLYQFLHKELFQYLEIINQTYFTSLCQNLMNQFKSCKQMESWDWNCRCSRYRDQHLKIPHITSDVFLVFILAMQMWIFVSSRGWDIEQDDERSDDCITLSFNLTCQFLILLNSLGSHTATVNKKKYRQMKNIIFYQSLKSCRPSPFPTFIKYQMSF